LVCFLIQFATGFAMTFYYKPTVAEVLDQHAQQLRPALETCGVTLAQL
jgi:quinol-cytochrome oxidoreductase complex cytochrome b subunit